MVNKMGNLPNIESITNGLVTLQKIRQLYKPESRAGSDEESGYIQPDRLSLIQDILSTVTNFIPQTRGVSYSNAFNQGNRYSSAYRELKHQIRSMNRNSIDQHQILQTLKLITPILDNKQKVYMDKFIKISDILQS